MTNLTSTLENLRVSYQMASLDVTDCDPSPFAQFSKWFSEALSSKCDEPNAFVLSTISGNKPRARVVLLKGTENSEFIFYTNYQSDKGDELLANPHASMTFLWLPLQRQIRIEGKIHKVSVEMSEDYFQKRPRGSQLGAIASPQSSEVSSREELEKMFKDTEDSLKDEKILPRPKNWGGYALVPEYFEFWQGRNNRMHDRINYQLNDSKNWTKSRLAP